MFEWGNGVIVVTSSAGNGNVNIVNDGNTSDYDMVLANSWNVHILFNILQIPFTPHKPS